MEFECWQLLDGLRLDRVDTAGGFGQAELALALCPLMGNKRAGGECQGDGAAHADEDGGRDATAARTHQEGRGG